MISKWDRLCCSIIATLGWVIIIFLITLTVIFGVCTVGTVFTFSFHPFVKGFTIFYNCWTDWQIIRCLLLGCSIAGFVEGFVSSESDFKEKFGIKEKRVETLYL